MRVAHRLASAAVACSAVVLAPGTATAATGLIVWAPSEQASVIREQLDDGFRGQPVIVVDKDADAIRRDLATVDATSAPDVIWADATWTGQLVGDRLVKRLPLSAGLRARFPANLLEAFRYGFADYGVPVTVAGDALVVNLSLVPEPPQTFAELQRTARRLVAANTASVGLAVGQGGLGDAHLLAPLFTGLGGYLFGKDPAGGLDPYNIGLGAPALLANADRIDGWNDSGLVSAQLSPARAQRTFVNGRAPFWITGPRSRQLIDRLPFDVAVVAVPPIVKGVVARPFLTVAGPMVTVYADRHGVGDLAAGLAQRYFASTRAQEDLASSTGTAPALRAAKVSAPVERFAAASRRGTPLPNIIQAEAVLASFRLAWARATSGAEAIPARVAFGDAQRAALQAVGQGRLHLHSPRSSANFWLALDTRE